MTRNRFERLLRDHAHLPVPREDGFPARAMADWEGPASTETARPRRPLQWVFGSLGALCCMTVFLILGTGIKATVTVDINPSLEMKINHFGYVIAVESANPDGDTFLTLLERKQGSIDQVLDSIVETAYSRGLITEGESEPLLIGVSARSLKEEQVLADTIGSALDSDSITPLFFPKHEEDGTLLHSGLVMKSASVFSTWLPGFAQQESMTSTVLTTGVPTSVSTAWVEDSLSNVGGMKTFDYLKLSETEFARMQAEIGVSEAKLTMAILVFNAYDTYILPGDLVFLCRLPVAELNALFQAIP